MILVDRSVVDRLVFKPPKPPAGEPPSDEDYLLPPKNRSLLFDISINDDNQYAALDVIVPTLEAVSFCGWMCETTYKYIEFLGANRQGVYSNDPVIQTFDQLVRESPEKWSWVDYYEHGHIYHQKFRDLQTLRIGRTPNLLRLELVSFEKINPSKLKVFAMSTIAGVVLITASGFSVVQGFKEADAKVCREQFIDLAKEQTKVLKELSRREGKWTAGHEASFRDIENAQNINVASCGSSLEAFSVKFNLAGFNFELGVTAGQMRKGNVGKKE